MGLYLQIEVNSPLSRDQFQERVIFPLGIALAKERLGLVLDGDVETMADGRFEFALEVTDQERAKIILEEVLMSSNG